MTTPKSEVRVTISMEDARNVYRIAKLHRGSLASRFKESFYALEQAIGIALLTQPRPEPTDEEKQAIISQ